MYLEEGSSIEVKETTSINTVLLMIINVYGE